MRVNNIFIERREAFLLFHFPALEKHQWKDEELVKILLVAMIDVV